MEDVKRNSGGRPKSRNPKRNVVSWRFTDDQYAILNRLLDDLRRPEETRAECFERHIIGFLQYQLRQTFRKQSETLNAWDAQRQDVSRDEKENGNDEQG